MADAHAIRYQTDNGVLDANGDTYYEVTSPVSINTQLHPSMSGWRPQYCRPRYAWIPFGQELITYDPAVEADLIAGTGLFGHTCAVFEAAYLQSPTNQFANGPVDFGSHPGGAAFWSQTPSFLIDADDANEFSFGDSYGSTHVRAHVTYIRRNRSLTLTDEWPEYAIGNVPMDHARAPDFRTDYLNNWRDTTINPYSLPNVIWHLIDRDTLVANGGLNPHEVIFLKVRLQNGDYMSHTSELTDLTAKPVPIMPAGYAVVGEYGEGYYRCSMVKDLSLQMFAQAGTVPGRDLFDYFVAGEGTSGAIAMKTHFPGSNMDEVVRYANYTRPSFRANNALLTPLQMHPGWSMTVTERGGIRRFHYDNAISTGHSLSLLVTDKIFFEIAHAGGYTLEARRLKHPQPTMNSVLGFTKPWNQEDAVIGYASDVYDMKILTLDQMDWEVVINAKDGNQRAGFATITGGDVKISEYIELGFITRSKTFRGEMPYVSWTRENYTASGI